ncbi:unnamed protein product [Arabidopsis halleri]
MIYSIYGSPYLNFKPCVCVLNRFVSMPFYELPYPFCLGAFIVGFFGAVLELALYSVFCGLVSCPLA